MRLPGLRHTLPSLHPAKRCMSGCAAPLQPRPLQACDAPPRPEGLDLLALVGDQLRHLSLGALPSLPGPLTWAATLPQLTCLSLRRNERLTGADLAPLAACTSLRALDLACEAAGTAAVWGVWVRARGPPGEGGGIRPCSLLWRPSPAPPPCPCLLGLQMQRTLATRRAPPSCTCPGWRCWI